MENANKTGKIKIIKAGPYIVSGNVPLYEKIIVPKGRGYEFKAGRELPQSEVYAICRCGKSKNAPFCDGSHEKAGFIGAETASRAKYEDRAELMEGSAIDLLDDRRCAFARFCHREKGNVWKLTEDRIARKTEEKRSRLPVIARRGSHPVPLRQIKQQAFLRRNACFYKFFR